MLLVFLALLLPVTLGVVAGAARLFVDADAAVAQLNRYPLYFAFPALVIGGVAGGDFAVPREAAFWALPFVELGLLASLVWVLSRARALRADAGSLAFAGMFGNVAYLGLPVVVGVLGDGALGLASLSASLFLAGSLAAGPFLFTRWSGGASAGGTGRRLLRQPLLWSPLVGLAGRALPAELRAPLLGVLAPLGKSAGPVALFVLGLFLFTRRATLRQLGAADLVAVSLRIVVAPALAFALCAPAVTRGWLSAEAARIAVLLSGMPTGVTAFALAAELQGGEALARAVVASTVGAALVLPALGWLATRF